MLRVALTGGIATGKSHVLDQCRRRGVPCLDADELAHGVMTSGTPATAAIASRFGADILAADGSVDRAKLGPLVFSSSAARHDLEAIVHPAVYRAITAALRAFGSMGRDGFAVVDVPLLYESGHASDFDRVIVTTCPVALQLNRLLARGLDADAARQRLAAQWPSDEKAARADFVIRTDGTVEDTNSQVERVLLQLAESARERT